MTVDISKIKVGDEVTVRGVCARAAYMVGHRNDSIYIDFPAVTALANTAWIDADRIVSHTPRPVAIGDKVRERPNGQHGEVLGLHGVQAWVRWGVNDFATTYAEGLERLDE